MNYNAVQHNRKSLEEQYMLFSVKAAAGSDYQTPVCADVCGHLAIKIKVKWSSLQVHVSLCASVVRHNAHHLSQHCFQGRTQQLTTCSSFSNISYNANTVIQ